MGVNAIIQIYETESKILRAQNLWDPVYKFHECHCCMSFYLPNESQLGDYLPILMLRG